MPTLTNQTCIGIKSIFSSVSSLSGILRTLQKNVFPNPFYDDLDCFSLCHVLPENSILSSFHLCGIFLLHLLFLGYHSYNFLHHLLFSLLASRRAHFHFHCSVFSAVSITLICSLIHVNIFLSLWVIPGIVFSIDLCVTWGFSYFFFFFFFVGSVNFHVSKAYSISHK